MKKLALIALTLSSFAANAANIHVSPEIKMGPYVGSGISGLGLQLGVADVLGLDALYVSYSHTEAEILLDEDKLTTYRIGGQYQLVDNPMKMALQLEAGVVHYEGHRDYIWPDKSRSAEGKGASVSGSWVVFVNDNVGFRLGADINYIDQDKTLFGTNWSAMLSSGVVLHF
ncbi:hypothetical protein [Vibrio atypicus]|uniref:hypothetical protein n=1 Tax=Vibrio atypicus TaxID=558271 RepID=UPI001357995A|nr:hypothetical protein [Vibrio atypicus]